MGDSRLVVLFGLMLLLVIPLTIGDSVFADKNNDKDKNDNKYKNDNRDQENTTPIINLGFLQLAAHDFFDMNRCVDTLDPLTFLPDCVAKDFENGKLDLSTVLFKPNVKDCNFKDSLNNKVIRPDQEDEVTCALYDDDTIANGGEKRSVENIMISTASAQVGEKYLKFVKKYGEEKAYQKTLKFYHEQIKTAYEESFHLKFPRPQEGEVTNLYNLAVRAGHDFLPAEIMFNGELTSLFAIDPLGEKLSKQEQRQPSSQVDGTFDDVFTDIDNFCPFPGFCITVDLLLADQTFGEQFGLGENTFDDFMEELEDGEFNKKDKISKLLNEVFARGINLD